MVTSPPPLLNQGTNGVINYGSVKEYLIYNSGTSDLTFTNDYDIYSGINSPFAYFYDDNGITNYPANITATFYYFGCSNILLNNIIVTGT